MENIKHTLGASKHGPHQQHLPKISQNVSGAVYGWQFDMKEISALFDNCYVRAFKQFH